MVRRSIPYSILILAIFLADQIGKRWAVAYLAAYGPTTFNRRRIGQKLTPPTPRDELHAAHEC